MIDKNIIAGAPTEEPARQQYFMEQVKKLVEAEARKRTPAHLFYQYIRVPDECQRLRKAPWDLKRSGICGGSR